MTTGDRYDFDYNKKEIEKRIEKFCSVARGTDKSILPLVNDADGKFSDRKAMGFINALVRTRALKGKEARFYKAFLYCTLKCYANESICDNEMYERFRPCSTFQDILDRARLADNDCKSPALNDMDGIMLHEFIEIDEYPFYEAEKTSFFVAMDTFYSFLTGNGYDSIDPEGFRKFFSESGKYREFVKEQEEALITSPEDIEACFEALAEENVSGWTGGETLEELRAEQEEYEKHVKAVNRRNQPAWNRFRDEFEGVDKFVNMYREYRKLFCEVKHNDFYNRVESMVYNYMFENGLSSFGSDPVVIDEMAVLDDITSQLKAALIRSRRRNGL